ncbi:hypothetical protein LENED_008581 [Lentinula edodes]|uniref:Uncharacterized protein n=1 Tax=Lentinula edodes TaxID=5353 RepID=A0A1Q3EHF0_LENED|nr:hypothetical protein LENED_008581 [Lentinula edodes]
MEEEQQFEYSTLYTSDGQPPVVAPAQGQSTTRIDSPILQAIARCTGKTTSTSCCFRTVPLYFTDCDLQPPVDPNNLGAETTTTIWMTTPAVYRVVSLVVLAVPAVPVDLVDPPVPEFAPDIPNEHVAYVGTPLGSRLLETLGTFLRALSHPLLDALNEEQGQDPELFDGSDPQKLKTSLSISALLPMTIPSISPTNATVNPRPPDLNSRRRGSSSLQDSGQGAPGQFQRIYDAQWRGPKDSLA